MASRTPPLRLEWRTPAELADNPANWRTHPETQTKALSGVVNEVGWAGAALFNRRTNRLIDGHARKKIDPALLVDGRMPVLVGDWTEEQERKILATLDPLGAMAEADGEKLEALLKSVGTDDPAIQGMFKDLAARHKVEFMAGGGNGDDQELTTELEDDDNPEALYLAPFPWFGGKSREARLVWKRFGNVPNFIEPFFGSGACLLNRPLPFDGNETVNDFDGLVCNFWRAVKADPEKVSEWADWPVNENDANARHIWLVNRKDSLQERLEGDPEHYDAKIAGWWCWGMACWIGSGFCSGEGPWQVQEVDGVRQLVHLGNAGLGVNRKRVHLCDAGVGVNRKLVHLGDAGQGDDAKPGRGECGLLAWMQALAERLRRVRVCCGDWTRVCGGNSGDALGHFFACGQVCGVFLDPPYSTEANRDMGCYRVDSGSVAHAVREWAIAHGDDPRLRICLCGYEGEHKMPATWEKVAWKAAGGMANQGNNQGKINAYRERLWFSPHCLKKNET